MKSKFHDLTFVCFKNLHVTIGAKRSLIVDSQRNKLHFIPNFLAKLLLQRKIVFNKVLAKNGKSEQDQAIIEEYFEYLLENEIIFAVEPALQNSFPPLNQLFLSDSKLENAIIEYEGNLLILTDAIEQIVSLGCQNIEVRFLADSFNQDVLAQCLRMGVKNLFLTANYQSEFSLSFFKDLVTRFPIIQRVFIGGAAMESYDLVNDSTQIIYTKDLYHPEEQCGTCGPNTFNLHQLHILESRSYNTCMNKKISIRFNGEICNCPSMKSNFGNINSTRIYDVLQNPEFSKLWEIKKDQIKICKDCEFRDICTDCRAYLQDPKDLFSKPLKCGYNPLTNAWSDWSLDSNSPSKSSGPKAH